jgi:hypothetical protein
MEDFIVSLSVPTLKRTLVSAAVLPGDAFFFTAVFFLAFVLIEI